MAEPQEQTTEQAPEPETKRPTLRGTMRTASVSFGLASMAVEFIRRPDIYPQFIEWMKSDRPEGMEQSEIDDLVAGITPELLESVDKFLTLNAHHMGEITEMIG